MGAIFGAATGKRNILKFALFKLIKVKLLMGVIYVTIHYIAIYSRKCWRNM